MAISRLQSVLTYGIYICCVNCEQSNYQFEEFFENTSVPVRVLIGRMHRQLLPAKKHG